MEQIKPIKDMTPRERAGYIFEYYKFHILAALIALFALVSIIVHYATYRTPVISMIMVNMESSETEYVEHSFDDFLKENGYNPKKKSVMINSSLVIRYNDPATYQEQTMLQMLIGTRSYSALFCDEEIFQVYAEGTNFMDLEQLVDSDILSKYQDDFLYATDPDSGRSYVCGIHLTSENNAWLSSSEAYEECYFGIFFSDSDASLIEKYLAYILR